MEYYKDGMVLQLINILIVILSICPGSTHDLFKINVNEVKCPCFIKTHDSESRGQEEAAVRDE